MKFHLKNQLTPLHSLYSIKMNENWFTITFQRFAFKRFVTFFYRIAIGLVGFTGFRSLFFDRTFKMKRSTKYQAQGKAKKKEKDHSHSERGKFSQEQTLTPSTTMVFCNASELKNNVIKFSDPALPYSLSILVFTAHLLYNCLLDSY